MTKEERLKELMAEMFALIGKEEPVVKEEVFSGYLAINQIAKKLGVDYHSVHNWIVANDIKPKEINIGGTIRKVYPKSILDNIKVGKMYDRKRLSIQSDGTIYLTAEALEYLKMPDCITFITNGSKWGIISGIDGIQKKLSCKASSSNATTSSMKNLKIGLPKGVYELIENGDGDCLLIGNKILNLKKARKNEKDTGTTREGRQRQLPLSNE